MTNSEENSRQLIEQVNLSIENYADYMEHISQVTVHSGKGGAFSFSKLPRHRQGGC